MKIIIYKCREIIINVGNEKVTKAGKKIMFFFSLKLMEGINLIISFRTIHFLFKFLNNNHHNNKRNNS